MSPLRIAFVTSPLLLATGCSSGQVTPLGPVPSEVTVDLQEQYYDVGGTTPQEILTHLRARAPDNRWFSHRWFIRWRYGYGEVEASSLDPGASSETVCKANNVRLTLEFERQLPRWTARESAPPELATDWDEFMRAVRIHGEGHRDIAVQATRDIVRQLRDLETQNCAFIQREARALVDLIIERANERDREYHAETEAGATQGVRWPRR